MKRKIKKILWLMLLGMTLFALYGEEGSSPDTTGESLFADEESLFSEEQPFSEADLFGSDLTGDSTEQPALLPAAEARIPEKTVELGGTFVSAYHAVFTWPDYNGTEAFFNEATTAFIPVLQLTTFLDARPDPNFRVFGKVKVTYPFSTYADAGTPAATLVLPSIQVFEAFSDFKWEDRLFFRIGKHTIKWGVGKYFSPADVLNLTPVDPEDPDAEQEGPLSLRVQYPFDLHNLYLYVIAHNITKPEELALAPKLELFFLNTELGIGGFFRKDLAPRAMVTVTNSLWGIDLFSECVVHYGDDRTFVRTAALAPLGIETYTRKEEWFVEGTLGFSWSMGDPMLMLSGQYLYNQRGYSDTGLLNDAMVYLLSPFNTPAAGPVLSAADLNPFGVHYGALAFNWLQMFGTELNFSLFWLGNILDGSGFISPGFSYQLFPYFTTDISAKLPYGDADKEFTALGRTPTVTLGLNLGSGRY